MKPYAPKVFKIVALPQKVELTQEIVVGLQYELISTSSRADLENQLMDRGISTLPAVSLWHFPHLFTGEYWLTSEGRYAFQTVLGR